ncbi:MAG: hypothetical protein HZC49_05405 [Nitrospirae bacterium]|nr:hypothetical protein [Nitrospirota bacterium]
MFRKTVLVVAVFMMLLSSNVYAERFALGLKASTLGVGVEAEGNVNDTVGGRIGFNYLTPQNYSGELDDIEYEFDIESKNVLAVLDWHPFSGSFRLSAGAVFNDTSFDSTAKFSDSAEPVDIGGTEYAPADIGNLKGDIEFNKVSPYIGLGWDTSIGKSNRFAFLSDIGVVFQGSPNIELSADGPISTNATFQKDLAQEEEDYQDDLNKFKYYPVIALGIGYRF